MPFPQDVATASACHDCHLLLLLLLLSVVSSAYRYVICNFSLFPFLSFPTLFLCFYLSFPFLYSSFHQPNKRLEGGVCFFSPFTVHSLQRPLRNVSVHIGRYGIAADMHRYGCERHYFSCARFIGRSLLMGTPLIVNGLQGLYPRNGLDRWIKGQILFLI